MYGNDVFLNIKRYDGIVAISLTRKLMIKSNISALGDYVVNWVRQTNQFPRVPLLTPEIYEL